MTMSPAASDARMGAIQCFLDSNTIVSPAIRLSAMATFRLLCPLGGRAATALVRTASVVVEARPCRAIAGSEIEPRLSSPGDRAKGARGSRRPSRASRPRVSRPGRAQRRPDRRRPVPPRRGHRHRRDGDRPSRARYQARAVRGRQAAPPRGHRGRRHRDALPARGPCGDRPAPPEHRRLPGDRHRRRPAVSRHGADRGRGPRGASAARRTAGGRRRRLGSVSMSPARSASPTSAASSIAT